MCNQQAMLDAEDILSESPRSKRRSRDARGDVEPVSDSSDSEPPTLTRSDALMGRGQFNPRHAWPKKEPAHVHWDPIDESDDDDEDKDLAWFFRRFHPEVDKYRQIAWCRTFANCLAAQVPTAKTVKKTKIKK